MTKQELLTKLAIECTTWKTAYLESIAYATKENDSHLAFFKQEWLAERDRLINKPDWKDVPWIATHLAMDSNGVWFSYTAEPYIGDCCWGISFVDWGEKEGEAIAIPAGYDWKDSLEGRAL